MSHLRTDLKAGPTDLPADLWIQILYLVEPIDILSLRRTCKKLLEVTFERHIWLEAFKRLLRTNNVLEGTFPLHSMSTSALEEATLRPFRLSHQLLRSRIQLPPPKAKYNLPAPQAANDRRYHSKRAGYKSFSLVDGGRFLVTRYNDLLIDLWDLNSLDESSESFSPLASLSPEREELREASELFVYACYARPRSSILYVLVTTKYVEFFTGELHVYKIIPTGQDPEFELVGTRYNVGMVQNKFDGKYLILESSNRLEFWDLEANLSISHPWTVSRSHHWMLAKDGYMVVSHPKATEVAIMKTCMTNFHQKSTTVFKSTLPHSMENPSNTSITASICHDDLECLFISMMSKTESTGQLQVFSMLGGFSGPDTGVKPELRQLYSLSLDNSWWAPSGGYRLGLAHILPLYRPVERPPRAPRREEMQICITRIPSDKRASRDSTMLLVDSNDNFKLCPVSCCTLLLQGGNLSMYRYF